MNEKSIHILSLVPYKIFPAQMGGQKGIALFYKFLSKLLTLTVYTTCNNLSQENYEVIPTITNSKLRYINPFLLIKIKKIITQKKITHILFEHPYYAWLLFCCKLFFQRKIILHTHNIESERFKSIGKWWWKILFYYERFAMRNADMVWFKTNEDMQYAHLYFGLDLSKCKVIPYGIEENKLPDDEDIANAKATVIKKHSLKNDDLIILFNGTLSYKPNLDALNFILDNINPILLQSKFNYKILICGKNLPPSYNQLEKYKEQNICYCGFVDDIDLYFKAADIFLNPLQDGGGIKTKLVEALGFGKYAVSSKNGAIGVDTSITNERLKIVADKDWNGYAQAILHFSPSIEKQSNQTFYNVFSWEAIAEKAAESLA